MPGWKTWAALEEVTASNMNSYVRDQVIAIYTNDAARTAAGGGTPSRGSQAFLTDTFEHQVYYGATTGWRKPWAMPWGTLGQYSGSTNLTYTTTGDTAISVASIPDVLNRRYRFTISAQLVNTSASQNQATFTLKRGASVIYTMPGPTLTASYTMNHTYTGTFTVSATATSTYTLSVGYLFANGIRFDGTASPNLLTIEDIGPATSTPPAS